MEAVMDFLYTLWNQIIYSVSHIRVFDILDILVIAYLCYKAIQFFRETRSGQLVKGLIVLFIVYLIAKWWKLSMIRWLLSVIVDSAIVALAVIFQPELRRILEKLGHTRFGRGQLLDEETERISGCIDSICRAAGMMQKSKTGALIVFERQTQLGEIINTGTVIDAAPSVSMTNNIFYPKSPLHDGALIVRNGRLFAAGCILPLTQKNDLSSSLGTRHRAGIGMTENSDAVVLIVSEETGTISLAQNGHIKQGYNAISLETELRDILIDSENERRDRTVVAALKRLLPFSKKEEANPSEKEGEQ